MGSVEVRQTLIQALRLDLVGPEKGSSLESELLSQRPSAWYLTGFLAPFDAKEEQRVDETVTEEVGQASDGGDLDDAAAPEPAAARRAFFPSSMGLSLLLPSSSKELQVTVRWADYRRQEEKTGSVDGTRFLWKRTPCEEKVTLKLPAATTTPGETEVPKSDGLKLALSVRPVTLPKFAKDLVPDGARSVSVFLVNRRPEAPDETKDEHFAFQTELIVEANAPLVPRPNLRGLDGDDWDERVGDLQFRDAFELAVGHGVATKVVRDSEGHCRIVHTCWIPEAEVERVCAAWHRRR